MTATAEISSIGSSAYQLNANSGDRFGFGFFVALVAHLIVIFGVVFEWAGATDLHQDLDVTLVTHYSEEAPDEADFLAQANQQASGTLDEAMVPTSPEPDARAENVGDQGSELTDMPEITQGNLGSTVLSTKGASDLLVEQQEGEESSSETQQQSKASSRQALLARLDMLRQDYAKRPKIGTLTSVAAKAREDAEYQIHLQERVIDIGNQNYPNESIEQSVFGELRIMLTILPDGSLERTEITESSGHQMLDRAAVKIARLAAPFAPFSRELGAKYDKIVFIRTWQFLPGGVLATEE